MGADSTKLRDFWTSFMNRPGTKEWASNHPFLKRKSVGDLVWTVPCSVHCDAGPVTKSKSANIVSWSSMVGFGGEKTSKFTVASYLKSSNNTDAPLWRALLNDFDHLATGVVGGTAVAGDDRKLIKFVLLVVKSDEEACSNEFGLPHFNSLTPCRDCLCDSEAK
eukprot:2556364-Pyramimonas_sp.AAC.1